MKPRIVWMVDESIANSKPSDWEKVLRLERELVDLIGSPKFSHEVVHPIRCLHNLVEKINRERFSCIIDLAGWLTPAFQELFPEADVFSGFSMSRVRNVSSVTLDTTGYTLTMTPSEVREIAAHIDKSRVLIVDDVSFSGWTSRKTMELWGIDPSTTTHAFLIANVGDLGPNPGAVNSLEALGSKVFWGEPLATPDEDGWHLKDLHNHPNLNEAFELSLILQYAFSEEGQASPMAKAVFESEKYIQTLFPDSLNSMSIRKMEGNGKFVLLNESHLLDGTVHAKNPFLWASPYFLGHVDRMQILSNRIRIKELLAELRTLTSDPEAKSEASNALRSEVRSFLRSGKERL